MDKLRQVFTDLYNRIQSKYGYTDEQMQAYSQAYIDCASEGQAHTDKLSQMLRDAVSDMCDALDLLEKANKDIAEQAGMFSKCRSCVYVECMSDGTHELHRCTHDQECWCGEYYKWRYADDVNKLLSKHADKENKHEG